MHNFWAEILAQIVTKAITILWLIKGEPILFAEDQQISTLVKGDYLV